MKAIILCAGFGTRMNHLTQNCPKPLLKIGGQPLLHHTLNELKKAGIKEVGINLHYLGELIRSSCGNGDKWGIKITYEFENSPTGTAGGARSLKGILTPNEAVFVIYGDIYTGHDYKKHLEAHSDNRSKYQAMATILLHQRKASNSIITVNDEKLITSFIERPGEKEKDLAKEWSHWVNSGIYCMQSNVILGLPETPYLDFPKDVFPKMVNQKLLYGIELNSFRVAIDSPDRYLEAQEIFSNL